MVKNQVSSYLSKRWQSVCCAWQGVRVLISQEPNVRIHAVATVVVVGLGAWLRLSLQEWALITVAIAMVWVAEAINTAIESAVDLCSPDLHPLAKRAKDVAAGAVLLASLFAVVLGVLVLGSAVERWAA